MKYIHVYFKLRNAIHNFYTEFLYNFILSFVISQEFIRSQKRELNICETQSRVYVKLSLKIQYTYMYTKIVKD